jgi:hypothetical protein
MSATLNTWDAIDYGKLQSAAWRFCRDVDATRSRRRADESAEDVMHDAALTLLGLVNKSATWTPVQGPAREGAAPLWGAFARIYVTRDGEDRQVTYGTLQRWAIKRAGKSHGYSKDVAPAERDLSAEGASVDHRTSRRARTG